MGSPDPNWACNRCNNPAPLMEQRTGKFEDQIMVEDVRLCAKCRIRAARENAAAANRMKGTSA